MADLFRMKSALQLVLVLLTLLTGWVHAETIPATATETVVSDTEGYWWVPESGCQIGFKGQFGSPSAAASAAISYSNSACQNSNFTGLHLDKESDTVYNQWFSCNNCQDSFFQVIYHSGCAEGSTWNGQACVKTTYSCPSADWILSGQSCTRAADRCAEKAGQPATQEGYFTGSIPSTACHDGCTSQWAMTCNGTSCTTDTVDVIIRTVNGKDTYYSKGKYVYGPSPAVCSGDTPGTDPGPLPPNTCGANQQGGYINGNYMCIDKDSGKPVDTAPPSTKTETTKTEKSTNSDGSTTETTTTTTTTNNTTTTTTVITTTAADGTKSSTTTTTGQTPNDVKDFCTQNPSAAICAKSSASGGDTCGTAPSCSGDAIQCSILRQSWENRCTAEKLKEGTDQLKPTTVELPDDPLGDGTNDDLPNGGKTETDVFQAFQEHRQTYLNFASECIEEWSFEFKGKTYKFDLTIVCQLAVFARLMLHLMAYMFVARLIHKTLT